MIRSEFSACFCERSNYPSLKNGRAEVEGGADSSVVIPQGKRCEPAHLCQCLGNSQAWWTDNAELSVI